MEDVKFCNLLNFPNFPAKIMGHLVVLFYNCMAMEYTYTRCCQDVRPHFWKFNTGCQLWRHFQKRNDRWFPGERFKRSQSGFKFYCSLNWDLISFFRLREGGCSLVVRIALPEYGTSRCATLPARSLVALIVCLAFTNHITENLHVRFPFTIPYLGKPLEVQNHHLYFHSESSKQTPRWPAPACTPTSRRWWWATSQEQYTSGTCRFLNFSCEP